MVSLPSLREDLRVRFAPRFVLRVEVRAVVRAPEGVLTILEDALFDDVREPRLDDREARAATGYSLLCFG